MAANASSGDVVVVGELSRTRSGRLMLVRTQSARLLRQNISQEVTSDLAPIGYWIQLLFYIAEVTADSVVLHMSRGLPCDQSLHTWMIGRICQQSANILFTMFMLCCRSGRRPAAGRPSQAAGNAIASPAGGSGRSLEPRPAASAGAGGELLMTSVEQPAEDPNAKPVLWNLVDLFGFAWFIYGCVLLFRCRTCKDTAYALFVLTAVDVSLSSVVIFAPLAIACCFCLCLPCLLPLMLLAARLAPVPLRERLGASPSEIEAIPRLRFEKGVCAPDDANCVMCLEAYEDGAHLRRLPCSHLFHQHCIDRWLAIKRTCPLCKQDITHRPGEVVV